MKEETKGNKIKLVGLGTGLEIRRLSLPEETITDWKEIAIKQNRTITELLLDPFFYYKQNNWGYNSWTDLPCEITSGMLIENKNQLEIGFNRKKIYKTNTADLINQLLLFPLFKMKQSEQSFISKKGIYIVNKEMGNLGVLEM